MKWIVTDKQWVGDEYDGYVYAIGEWRCRFCDEVIEPKKKTTYAPEFVEGPTTFIVTIEGETFYLSPEEYAQAMRHMASAMREASSR